MKERPHNPRAPLIGWFTWWRIALAALAIMGGSFAVYLYAHFSSRPTAEVYALTLTTMAFGEWVVGLTARSSMRSIVKTFRGNRSIISAFFIVGIMQALILYIPPFANVLHVTGLTAIDWLVVLLGVIPVIVVEEIQKWIRRRSYHQRPLIRASQP